MRARGLARLVEDVEVAVRRADDGLVAAADVGGDEEGLQLAPVADEASLVLEVTPRERPERDVLEAARHDLAPRAVEAEREAEDLRACVIGIVMRIVMYRGVWWI